MATEYQPVDYTTNPIYSSTSGVAPSPSDITKDNSLILANSSTSDELVSTNPDSPYYNPYVAGSAPFYNPYNPENREDAGIIVATSGVPPPITYDDIVTIDKIFNDSTTNRASTTDTEVNRTVVQTQIKDKPSSISSWTMIVIFLLFIIFMTFMTK